MTLITSPCCTGYYMYIPSSRQQGDIARLISPTYRLYRGSQCLLFWTHMYGSSTGNYLSDKNYLRCLNITAVEFNVICSNFDRKLVANGQLRDCAFHMS